MKEKKKMNFTEKLGGLLPDGIDCFLVTSELNQRYLTGLNYTDGYVIVSREKSWLLADFRYIEVAKRYETDTLEVVQLENRKVNLGNIFADNKFSKVGFESNNMTVARLNGLKETFPLADFVPVGGIIEKMRRDQDPGRGREYRQGAEDRRKGTGQAPYPHHTRDDRDRRCA